MIDYERNDRRAHTKASKLSNHGPKRCGGTVVDRLYDEKKGKAGKLIEVGFVCSRCGKVYYE